MKDIDDRKDLEQLVTRFYDQVKTDQQIGPFFTEIADINWPEHIQKITNFWETTLLGNITYHGNPMAPHFKINEIRVIKKEDFAQWISLFTRTVDSLFEGENANTLKERAKSIALLMEFKVTQQ